MSATKPQPLPLQVKQKRIALIGPVHPFRGGIAHHTAQLAKAIEASGHEATVISFRRQYPQWLYPGKSDKDPSPSTLDFSPSYLLDPLYPWTWEAAYRYLASQKPDLVVFQWWTTFWGPAFVYLGRRLAGKSISTVFLIHNVLPHELRPWDRGLARAALGTGTAYITQSKRESQRLQDLIPGAMIVPCQLPLYTIFDQGRITKDQARVILDLPADDPVILFFGIVRPYKGLRDLIQASACLRDRDIPFQLVIAGEFWEPISSYEAEINRLDLHARIHIHDRYIPNEEVSTFFSAADIFAAPYTAGTQSAAVTSALSYGLPVVMSETIADSAAGRGLQEQISIVPAENPEKLAEAIESVLISRRQIAGNLSMIADESWRELVNALLALTEPTAGER